MSYNNKRKKIYNMKTRKEKLEQFKKKYNYNLNYYYLSTIKTKNNKF